jgi:hypothetical protein
VTSAGLPGSWSVAGEDALAPLVTRAAGFQGGTGFDIRGFDSSVWILHPMWERRDGTPIATFDDSLPSAPDRYERLGVDAVIDYGNAGKAAAEYPPPGWPRAPGAEYRRLRWRDYADRYGVPMVRLGYEPAGAGALPGPHAEAMFHYFDGPDEGSLDVETWFALLDVLLAHTPGGPNTTCYAFYTSWVDPELPSVLCGPLGHAAELVDHAERDKSPQNLWPDELEWLVYTDHDGVATRVSGTCELIENLKATPTFETYTSAASDHP